MPAKKPKYHFLKLNQASFGKYWSALPGQTFGKTPVPAENILVKDGWKSTALTRMKKKASIGEIYFTTTLKQEQHCMSAKDIYPLYGHGNVLYADAEEEYNKLIKLKKNGIHQ